MCGFGEMHARKQNVNWSVVQPDAALALGRRHNPRFFAVHVWEKKKKIPNLAPLHGRSFVRSFVPSSTWSILYLGAHRPSPAARRQLATPNDMR